jgi:hypothetical protein
MWTDEAGEDMRRRRIKMAGVEEDFTGSQGAQRAVGHEEEKKKKKKEEKKEEEEEAAEEEEEAEEEVLITS